MKSLQEIFSENYEDETVSISDWCDEIYSSHFKGCYDLMYEVKKRIKISDNGLCYGKLTEEDLERIITELPMDLYTASEALNKLRLQFEMVKLKYKQVRREILQKAEGRILSESFSGEIVSKSKLNQMVQEEVQDELMEHELLIKAYESVISRAENERSSCRELIMGAKKIWDSRRAAEQSNPISETNTELPDYKEVARNQYVK